MRCLYIRTHISWVRLENRGPIDVSRGLSTGSRHQYMMQYVEALQKLSPCHLHVRSSSRHTGTLRWTEQQQHRFSAAKYAPLPQPSDYRSKHINLHTFHCSREGTHQAKGFVLTCALLFTPTGGSRRGRSMLNTARMCAKWLNSSPSARCLPGHMRFPNPNE